MKLIGLLGGMSWESTAEYYRIMNQEVRRRLGGQHSARIVLNSVDFETIDALQVTGDWVAAGRVLLDEARRLERAGAELLMLCTNTMHKVADAIEAATSMQLVHIADATGERVSAAKLARVGLLGTRFTMREDFYRQRLERSFGLSVLLPEADDQALVDRVIYDELCQGQILDASRREYLRVIAALAERGAQGVILGCTEIGLLIKPEDSPLPAFDTARIHAEKGVELALH